MHLNSSSDTNLHAALQRRIDEKTKPLGSLGRLEALALQIGLIQGTVSPNVDRAAIYVFAADHGIAKEGVSAYPQEVTTQMVLNFIRGGAAINVFAKLNALQLTVVDAGVASVLPVHPLLTSRRIGPGTRNFLHEPAMTGQQCTAAMAAGRELVAGSVKDGVRVLGFGEMGIGNTSSAAILTSLSTGAALERCVGRGAGLDEAGLARKVQILRQAIDRHGRPADTVERLRTFGGFEIAMLVGAILEAARQRMVILIDGFIVSAALSVASDLRPDVTACCVFSHRSAEPGHDLLLEHFQAKPVLDLSMRLGEGTGAALVYPLIKAAAAFLNEMATFESAGVSRKTAE